MVTKVTAPVGKTQYKLSRQEVQNESSTCTDSNSTQEHCFRRGFFSRGRNRIAFCDVPRSTLRCQAICCARENTGKLRPAGNGNLPIANAQLEKEVGELRHILRERFLGLDSEVLIEEGGVLAVIERDR